MVDFYISVIKRYRKELLKLSTLIVADSYFSTSTFVNGIKKEGFSLISRYLLGASLPHLDNEFEKFLAVTINDADIEIYHSLVSKTQFFIT